MLKYPSRNGFMAILSLFDSAAIQMQSLDFFWKWIRNLVFVKKQLYIKTIYIC